MGSDLYLYYDELWRDALEGEFTEEFEPYTHGIIFQVPNRKNNVYEYVVLYDKMKNIGCGIDITDLWPNLPGINLVICYEDLRRRIK